MLSQLYRIYLKRVLDVVFAILLLVLISPILLIVYVLIYINGGKPIFSQMRLGKNGEIFKIYKFRTMVVGADQLLSATGTPLTNRVTKLGKILRVTSLDELPQLINIITGDMSFIGPRPVLTNWSDEVKVKYAERFSVRPGITGLAQINGRNLIPWSKRVSWDIKYATNYSFRLDVGIVLKSIAVIFGREGISLDRNTDKMDDL